MFDVGFAELLIIGVVALLVIGPERLPGAVRTASAWINRFRRGFNEIKQEVQQELHNDAVLQDLKQLRDTGEDLRRDAANFGQDLKDGLVGDNGKTVPENAGATETKPQQIAAKEPEAHEQLPLDPEQPSKDPQTSRTSQSE